MALSTPKINVISAHDTVEIVRHDIGTYNLYIHVQIILMDVLTNWLEKFFFFLSCCLTVEPAPENNHDDQVVCIILSRYKTQGAPWSHISYVRIIADITSVFLGTTTTKNHS